LRGRRVDSPAAHRGTTPAQRHTDRRTDRSTSSAQRWAKGGRDLPHRCAQVGHTSRSYAHRRSDRPTDRRTHEPASAAHRWAKLAPSLRICGPHLAQRCAQGAPTNRQTDEPTDALTCPSYAQRWARSRRLLRSAGPVFGVRCAVAQRPTDRPTNDPHQQRWTCDHLSPIVLICLSDTPIRCINLRQSPSSQPNAA
jgi:hypothetical protein